MLEKARTWLTSLGFSDDQSDLTLEVAAVVGIAVLAVLANWVAKRVILNVVRRVVRRTKSKWDDVLVERKVFERLSHLAPALIIWWLAPVSISENYTLSNTIRVLAEIYMVLACVRVVYALLEAVRGIIRGTVPNMRAPIRVYIQVIKILVGIAAAVLIFSITLDKSPWVFLSGLGAMTAVLMLIFKDSILGLVAGVQLSANDMVRNGDWISMPQFGADGDVMEVALTTVKVRNWDKTITTIPTYALISNSFKNWRGMEMSG
ncbi:MAG: mechanosensitive ion channel, partial [Candidatus Latescibacterota bacterium]